LNITTNGVVGFGIRTILAAKSPSVTRNQKSLAVCAGFSAAKIDPPHKRGPITRRRRDTQLPLSRTEVHSELVNWTDVSRAKRTLNWIIDLVSPEFQGR
jgi:hypothetical protein